MSVAKHEDECYHLVSKLLVALFGVARSSVALLTADRRHVLGVQLAIVKKDMANVFQIDKSGYKFPLQDTAFGHIAETREIYYNPDLQERIHWNPQKMMRDRGMRTSCNVPLLVHGKFVGALSMVHTTRDAFSHNDLMLLRDAAACLAGNLHSRRLEEAQRAEQATMKNILHALIPEKVLDEISQHFARKDGGGDGSADSPLTSSSSSTPCAGGSRANKPAHDTQEIDGADSSDSSTFDDDSCGVREQLAVFSRLRTRRGASGEHGDGEGNLHVLPPAVQAAAASEHPRGEGAGIQVVESGAHRPSGTMNGSAMLSAARGGEQGGGNKKWIGRALYAEDRPRVCIIFSDVVSFSRIVDGAPVKP